MRTTGITGIIGLAALLAPALASAEPDDAYVSRYGETRINSLPRGGSVTKKVWVGSWWDYTRDGIAFRYQTGDSVDAWKKRTDRFADHADEVVKGKLSPAEKLDHWLGRADEIDPEPLGQYLGKVLELGPDLDAKLEEKQTLVRKLNAVIAEKSGEAGFDWKTTDDGKKYLELDTAIKEASKALDEIKKTTGWKLDTATEHEVMKHGNGQFGIGDWWGHCNAWSAAAIMEPEPVREVTVGGVTFTPADLKALLTEAWMECQSSFYGARNEWDGDEEARVKADFKDVTPAAFHIHLADQIGNKDKSFVIDRYTGSQVWNQPLKAYRSFIEPAYEVTEGAAAPVKRAVKLTRYDGRGVPAEKELGERELYPVTVQTTFWWVTDGLPHDAITVEGPAPSTVTDAQFKDWWWVKKTYDDQIHIRTVSYELWLTKPLDDPEARIVGDGVWMHGDASQYNHSHPDFMWQPLDNVNNAYRDYENEYVDYDRVVEELLPGAIAAHEDPAAPEQRWDAADVPKDIPDDVEEPTVSVVTVEGGGVVHGLAVTVDIEHTYIGDLVVELVAPAAEATGAGCVERAVPGCDGCSCEACVCEANPACCGTAWDASCAAACTGSCGGCEGAKVFVLKKKGDGGSSHDLKQTFDVTEAEGMPLAGTWTLRVSDRAAQDVGVLKAWGFSVR